MKDIKNIKRSLVYNIIIFILVLIAAIMMYSKIQFHDTGRGNPLDESGFSIFKFFTVDSNILVAITGLLLSIYECKKIKNKETVIPNWVYALKYMGTCSVALTFIITLIWLSPSLGKNFYLLYLNSNFMFHLVVPILAFISYTKYEKNDLGIKSTFLCFIPLFLYSIYYISNLIVHFENNTVSAKYDIYGFAKNGKESILTVFIVISIITYIGSYIIYRFNKRKNA